MKQYILVGDIGGTNLRLGLCNINNGLIKNIYTYKNYQKKQLNKLILNYTQKQNLTIKKACIAIASPVINKKNNFKITNNSCIFKKKKIKHFLNLKQLEIINDFAAISMSIPMLNKTDTIKIGGRKSIKNKPIVIYGAGTGLGVSHLIRSNYIWINLPGEGGHVDLATNNKEEDNILTKLRNKLSGHVSAERVLSGPGIVNLYKIISQINGYKPKRQLQPYEIAEKAIKNKCTYSYKTLSIFCALMGSFGGNLALNMGTLGGVYIAGGIIPNFINFFCKSNFRTAFEDKGRFKQYLTNIPVYLIQHKQPGLLGAGAYIRQKLGYKL